MKTSSTIILLACATVGLLVLLSSTSAQAATNAGSQSKGLHAQPRTAAGCTPTPTATPAE